MVVTDLFMRSIYDCHGELRIKEPKLGMVVLTYNLSTGRLDRKILSLRPYG